MTPSAPALLPTLDLADLASAGSRRWLRPWDVCVTVGLLAIIAVVGWESDASALRRSVAVSCLAAILVSWFAGARRVAGSDQANGGRNTRPALVYVCVFTALFALAVAAAQLSSYALFALCPIAFLCLNLRAGIVAVSVLNLIPVPFQALSGGTATDVQVQAIIAVIGLAFSVLLGTAIDGIAGQSADRARLIVELEASRAQVAALSHEAGVSAERARLATEIHDTLAQGFASVVALVQAAESELDADRPAADRHLNLAVRTARENLAEARAMVTALAPADLRAGTLADLIAGQVARLAEETGAVTSCAVEGIPADLPTTVEVVLVRALQESLANVRKHAEAQTVTVDLLGTDEAVTLTVSDDGKGFDPQDRAPRGGSGDSGSSGGYGLRGMRARVEQVGGVLTLRSAPGKGTTLELELPR